MTTAHATKFDSPAVHTRSTGPFSGQLKVESQFCPSDVADPMDTVEWETRTSQIQGEGGEVVFEQTNCEVPSFWSQLATNVICSKYFY
ncbi:MAG: hypothetical protein MK161_11310, partial [Pirellulales bacterium]|nr:hypothetical protein [Pirellulales bacterium]